MALGPPTEAVSPDEWAAFMPRPSVLSSLPGSWTSLSAKRFLHPPGDVAAPPMRDHLIVIHFAGPSRVEWRLDGRLEQGRTNPGDIMVMAANQANDWRWDGACDVLHVYLKAELLEQVGLEAELPRVELASGFGLHDPHIRQIGRSILRELVSPGLAARLYGDVMAQTLAVQLLRRHLVSPKRPRQAAALAPFRLRRAIEFVEAHYAEDLTLAEIAQAASTSPSHFAHGFKQATGFSPHQYLTHRRIERAKQLLTETDLPLMEIALTVGFPGQSHFATVFRKLCDATPRQYRTMMSS